MYRSADKKVCGAKTVRARNKPFGDFIDRYVNSKCAKFAGASLTGSGDIELETTLPPVRTVRVQKDP